MRLPPWSLVLGLAFAGCSARDDTALLASLDPGKISAAGLQTAQVNTVADFKVTYLRGPKESDQIGIYQGGHPGLLSSGRKRSAEVKDTIAGQPVTWICWEDEEDGALSFEAEVVFDGKRVKWGAADPYVEKIHVFLSRPDAESLAEARKIAASLFVQGPTKPTGR